MRLLLEAAVRHKGLGPYHADRIRTWPPNVITKAFVFFKIETSAAYRVCAVGSADLVITLSSPFSALSDGQSGHAVDGRETLRGRWPSRIVVPLMVVDDAMIALKDSRAVALDDLARYPPSAAAGFCNHNGRGQRDHRVPYRCFLQLMLLQYGC